MNKIILSLAILLSSHLAYAQPLSEGKNYFYYQRYHSAQLVFEKNINDDAKNAEAWYWLALSQLESGKSAEAKTTIKTGMEKTNNDPLLKIAMGHSFILENNKTEARSSFDAALSSPANAGKAILQVAIGRACADGSLSQGDPDFGIEMLNSASQTDTKNPELYVLMGRCQLKLGGEHGSEGWGSFNKALQIDPSYADAYYRIGLIFQSQNNVDLMRENYDKAIQADPKFAPAYLAYFNYYKVHDVALAQKNLALYIKNADKDCSSSLYQAEYSSRTGNYNESINILKQIEQDVCKNEPRIKVLYAFNYNATGDIDAARSSIENFLATATAEKINAGDYKLAGDIMARIPGQENKAGDYYQRFIDKDTVKSEKILVMQTAATLFEKSKNYAKAAEWYQKILNSKETPNNIDYFNCGIAYYGAANYTSCIGIFKIYSDKYPGDWRGPFWQAKANAGIDKTMTTWAAVPYYEKFISLAANDASVAKQLSEAYVYLFAYQYNKKKDKATAMAYLNKASATDPNNAEAKKYKALLSK